jgi:hypothetical protein
LETLNVNDSNCKKASHVDRVSVVRNKFPFTGIIGDRVVGGRVGIAGVGKFVGRWVVGRGVVVAGDAGFGLLVVMTRHCA